MQKMVIKWLNIQILGGNNISSKYITFLKSNGLEEYNYLYIEA